MLDVPRWLARAWVWAGAVGLAAALVGGAMGIGFIGSATAAAMDGLSTTDRSLEALEETAGVLRGTLAEVSEALRDVQQTLADSSVTMTQLAKLTGDVGDVVAMDIPESLSAVNEAMPPLIATAGVIDATMRVLRFIGVDYDPDQPLDDALAAIEEQLASIPPTLEAQGILFEGVADGLAEFGGDSLDVAADLAAIRSSLAGSGLLLEEYVAVAGEAARLISDLSDRLETQARIAQVLMGVLGLAVAGVMTLPMTVGWLAMGRELPGASHRSNP